MKRILLYDDIQNFCSFFINKLKGASLFVLFHLSVNVFAQCPGGYNRDTLNWDYLDFFHKSGSTYGGTNPVTGLPFVTTAMAQTQYFSVAGNKITINTVIPVGGTSPFYGDVTLHTGETGSYGNGEDVKLMGNGTVTISFQTAVQNVKFSIYDIDYNQKVTVTALNGASSLNITMAKVSGTNLTIAGSGTTSASATAGATNAIANTSSDGTANVDIAGPVTNITITISQTGTKLSGPASGQEDGGFFLSDISACMQDPSYPTNYYYNYTQPFTGQPAYFLANPQNLHVYMIDPSTGLAEYIFSDPGTVGNKMNSLAYDPVNKWLYYVMDNASQPPGNLVLKKYDFNTESISTVISNLNTFGIPSFIQGIEYAGAAFYNGSLYLGIEGSDGTTYSTGAESVIWKIDFDGSGNPTTYALVFGTMGYIGWGAPRHDWGDLVTKDGFIITHATGPTTASNHYIHYNLQSGTATSYNGNSVVAGQLGQTYNGNIYRIKDSVALYNGNGSIGSSTKITVSSCSPAWSGNAGDASDPFKPKLDFGDAPSSYDPDPLAPAVHQKNCNNSTLRIGSAWDREWSKNTSADASGDDTDEDGVSTVLILVSDGLPYNYVQEVTVLNNTGATATLGGWVDFDADGVFEASEGVIVTVPSSASPQIINLGWNNITVATGTPNTFLRIRLVSGTGTLTVNNPTGWYSDGEVEDYLVVSSFMPLTIQLLDLNAAVTKDKNVLLTWKANTDADAAGFEIERSSNQDAWEKTGWINAITGHTDYRLLDQEPPLGRSYYRLKMVEKNGTSRYSNTVWIDMEQVKNNLKIYPNPASSNFIISFNSDKNEAAVLSVSSLTGALIRRQIISVQQGINRLQAGTADMQPGIYVVELKTQMKSYMNKITVLRK